MTDASPRRPVLAGIATCHDDVDVLELLVRAARAAGEDAAGASADDLLGRVGRIAVTRGSWALTNPAQHVGRAIGATHATTVLVEIGIPQQTVIDEAMAAIAAGEIDVALVLGGEAKAHDARQKERSTKADAAGIADVFRAQDERAGDYDPPHIHQIPQGDLVDAAELTAGLWAPVEQYALIENALGAAEGRTPDELRAEVSALYDRFNAVAAVNPDAAFPARRTADELAEFAPGNRPLAFPYAKWHATQWTVDQSAALLLCSTAVADEFGVSEQQRVHPIVGVSSSHILPLSQRADMHRWPAMEVLGRATEKRLGRPVADCDLHELYSCFPVAVRVQQRELGLPLDGTPTITGGMAFAGGPFNNFVFQATVAMARRLRNEGGTGAVTSVSGLLTKPGLGVWAAESDGEEPLIADLADEVAAATGAVPVVLEHDGEATIASYTVTFDGQEPTEVIVLVDTPDGSRSIGRSSDAATIERAMTEGLVGRRVRGQLPAGWAVSPD